MLIATIVICILLGVIAIQLVTIDSRMRSLGIALLEIYYEKDQTTLKDRYL
jgi:hypothetical protein